LTRRPLGRKGSCLIAIKEANMGSEQTLALILCATPLLLMALYALCWAFESKPGSSSAHPG